MLRRVAALLGSFLSLQVFVALPAVAEPPVGCPDWAWDPVLKICYIEVSDPGTPPGGGGDGGDGGGGGGGGDGAPDLIPCEVDGFEGYYAGIANPQPPANETVWEGHEPGDGAIYRCVTWIELGTGNVLDTTRYYWAAAPPGADPDPEALAQRAIARMQFEAVGIGIVPEDAPGRVGLVGLPTWMWVQNPTASTVGPITEVARLGPFEVTATARLDRIEWDMGNGDTTVCVGPGTPYEDRFGKQESPDCGYLFREQGRYTVTARSFWTVAWQGLGQRGTIVLNPLVRETQITIGEMQVLTQ